MREGSFRYRGQLLTRPLSCGDRAAIYSQSLEMNKPHVAVVIFGPWEVLDRQLPGEETWRAPGDPILDARIREEMDALVELLSRDGAIVLWVTAPAIKVRTRNGEIPTVPFPESDPARMLRFNEMVFDLERRHPGIVRAIDLAAYLRALPDGEFDTYRTDGVHISRPGAARIVNDWLADEILNVARSQRQISLRSE